VPRLRLVHVHYNWSVNGPSTLTVNFECLVQPQKEEKEEQEGLGGGIEEGVHLVFLSAESLS
jgi:hypothetical protein